MAEEGVASEAYRIFFTLVSEESIVARDREVKRLKRTIKKIKQIGKSSESCCPVCDLILEGDEKPKYCHDCNVPLPCVTWRKEEHLLDEGPRFCDYCDRDVCFDCYNDDTGLCLKCL